MIAYIVAVSVKSGQEDSFRKATKTNGFATRQEPGNMRFDLLVNPDSPSNFTLYEVYQDQKALDQHKKTAHYLKWREDVAIMMAKPRLGSLFELLDSAPQATGTQ